MTVDRPRAHHAHVRDLHDTVVHLRSRIEHDFLATGLDHLWGTSESEVEPSSRWVLEAVARGRSLPINPSTVKALRGAIIGLEAAVRRSTAD